MNKTLILLIITVFSFSCNNNWETYEIPNAINISVPNELELRGRASMLNKAMDKIRDEYNPSHDIKIGKSELIFQLKGTDNLEETAIIDVTRILVTHFKIDSNSFPKWDFKLSKQELNVLSEHLKKQLITDSGTMPFKCEVSDWAPLKMGSFNGLNYMKGSYIKIIDRKASYTETYQFFNTNEKVIITFSTSMSDKNKWIDIFNKVIKTFKFNQKK